MKTNKNDIIYIIVIFAIAYFLFGAVRNAFKNLFGAIGIGDTTTDEEREENITKTAPKVIDNAFDVNYWNKPNAKLFKVADVKKMAKTIYDAIGYVYDSPEDIVGVFKWCKYKSQVSWLAYHFNLLYKKDLYSFLNDRLDTDEQRSAWLGILSRIKKLPKGF